MRNCVIAYYNEDLSWIKALNNFDNFFIYNKSNNNKYIKLPNIGREAHTYLYHIVNNYDNILNTPDDVTLFTQGKISDHTNKTELEYTEDLLVDAELLGISINNARDHKFNKHSATYDFRIKQWPPGNILEQEPQNLNFGQWFTKYIKNEFPEIIYWWVGAIFAVKHKFILNNTREYYNNILNLFISNSPEIAHYMERAWLYLFLSDSIITPNIHKLIYIWSDNIIELKNLFDTSLNECKDFFEIKSLKLDLNKFNNSYGFRTESWYHCLYIKILYIRNIIKLTNNSGEYIVCSDIDIHFFKPKGLLELINTARYRDLYFYGMHENNINYKYNGGFYIIKSCNAITRMFDYIVSMIEEKKYPYGDQDIINEYLLSGKLYNKHDIIPKELTCWGPQTPLSTNVFHHAVCTNGLKDKLEQIKKNYITYITSFIINNIYESRLIISSKPKLKNYNRQTKFIYISDILNSIDIINNNSIDLIELDVDILDNSIWIYLYNFLKYTGYIIIKKLLNYPKCFIIISINNKHYLCKNITK
jgi:hypothetical protein